MVFLRNSASSLVIAGSTAYTADKNYVASQTDARGKTVTMVTDANEGTVTSVTDPAEAFLSRQGDVGRILRDFDCKAVQIPFF